MFSVTLLQAMHDEKSLVEIIMNHAKAEFQKMGYDATQTQGLLKQSIWEYKPLDDVWEREPDHCDGRQKITIVRKVLNQMKSSSTKTTRQQGTVSFLEPIDLLQSDFRCCWKGNTHAIQLAQGEEEIDLFKYSRKAIDGKELVFQDYKRLQKFATMNSKILIEWWEPEIFDL